ncbi:hypothetical protein HK105_206270 [Polyrhizophydium stewartii]|uniref:UspA domain-containing protein n=1 Tax=Polyrhizophydium stewartii TaxID=2732419 RepID=A0ABR4N3W1_9FUNG
MLASETAAPAAPALEPAAAAVAAAPAEPAARRHQPRTVHEESSDYALTWAVNNILKPETDQVVLLNMIKHDNIHVRAIALRGDPREELLHKIEHLKADLVVMGSRGLGALSRTFLGSVSDYLTHNLKVPVIVTRLPEA